MADQPPDRRRWNDSRLDDLRDDWKAYRAEMRVDIDELGQDVHDARDDLRRLEEHVMRLAAAIPEDIPAVVKANVTTALDDALQDHRAQHRRDTVDLLTKVAVPLLLAIITAAGTVVVALVTQGP